MPFRTKLLAALLLSLGLLAAQDARLSGIDKVAGQLMSDWKVPGVAIAVVDHGNIVLSKGYGFRDVAAKQPVTSKTLFAIGSISKSFTVSAMHTLAEQGRLDWNKPVRDYLPSFRMYDPVATAEMTPLDLVTHRSGLPRHDALWYSTNFTRKELFDKLRYLQPNKAFRELYQYQNLMFMTAGYLAGELAGSSWEDLVQKRIFDTLGMTNSNFSVKTSQKASDFSLPYSKTEDQVSAIPFHIIDEIGPAGSINSNVVDMAKYVQMHLAKGKGVMNEKSWTMMTTPQMAITSPRMVPELGDSAYGMALTVHSYRGHKMVSHGGGIDGFTAWLALLPEDQIGVIILTNLGGNPIPQELSYSVFDALLGLPSIDWPARLKALPTPTPRDRTKVDQIKGTLPSHPLADFAGEYTHPGYGRIKIDVSNGDLRMDFNGAHTSALKHFHYDVFEANLVTTSRTPVKVAFYTGLNGRIERIGIPLEPQVADIEFVRAGAK